MITIKTIGLITMADHRPLSIVNVDHVMAMTFIRNLFLIHICRIGGRADLRFKPTDLTVATILLSRHEVGVGVGILPSQLNDTAPPYPSNTFKVKKENLTLGSH